LIRYSYNISKIQQKKAVRQGLYLVLIIKNYYYLNLIIKNCLINKNKIEMNTVRVLNMTVKKLIDTKNKIVHHNGKTIIPNKYLIER